MFETVCTYTFSNQSTDRLHDEGGEEATQIHD